jgi:hypothetical protein
MKRTLFFIALLLLVTLSIFLIACTPATSLTHLHEFNRRAELFHGEHDIAFTATYTIKEVLNHDFEGRIRPEKEKRQYTKGEIVFQRVSGVVTVVVWELIKGWRIVEVPAEANLAAFSDQIEIIGTSEDEQSPVTIKLEKIENYQKEQVTCEETIASRLAHFNLAMGGICEYSYASGRTRRDSVKVKSYFISSCEEGRFMPLHYCTYTTFDRRGNPIFDWQNTRRHEYLSSKITLAGEGLSVVEISAKSKVGVIDGECYKGYTVIKVSFKAVFA